MATFTLTVEMDNAAFDRRPATELARVLIAAAHRIQNGDTAFMIRDVNGNTVGRAETTK